MKMQVFLKKISLAKAYKYERVGQNFHSLADPRIPSKQRWMLMRETLAEKSTAMWKDVAKFLQEFGI